MNVLFKYVGVALAFWVGCGSANEKKTEATPQPESVTIESVASHDHQWTGIAVGADGSLILNLPTWSDDVPISVGVWTHESLQPFPTEDWNGVAGDSESGFICVQSVYTDDQGNLWILDPANPKFEGVVEGGPKLYEFKLGAEKPVRTYSFPEEVIDPNSYLNDVRIDTDRRMAYLTDSGFGALLTVDLESGEVHRFLADHPSVKSEVDSLVMSDGSVWRNTVHSDGIALSPDRKWLYYTALTGHTLYRVPTDSLSEGVDPSTSVEKVADIGATDGMWFGQDGVLYLGGLESDAIFTYTEAAGYQLLVRNPAIRWADSFAEDAEGNVYFTTSQIHLPESRRGAYEVFRIHQKKTR
ncbi:L-dopachrome tautomerase-related protein [Pontibacter sp. G13]|uniref:L-dopachrome tautomerase-related protein n=1 Tax=Pontibacter sp. G13 TaxID=3074898 RepID=UPI00288ADEC6|nr:L-dopachrome tautomerase-related protein [Pontibacter sp. G13]WNJ18224.1 L-dopachrome tautomerase-related protein [Pontibacter sp. G13]